jgi:hypothetical protein
LEESSTFAQGAYQSSSFARDSQNFFEILSGFVAELVVVLDERRRHDGGGGCPDVARILHRHLDRGRQLVGMRSLLADSH